MAKKTGASKRLAGWRAFAQHGRLLPKLPEGSTGGPNRALRLDPASKRDQSMIAAFKAFGLDHTDPYDWRTLMIYFADAHFGRRGGAPVVWNFERLCALFTDYVVLRERHPDKVDEDICELLSSDKRGEFAGRYRKIRGPTVRRKLQDARRLIVELRTHPEKFARVRKDG